MLLASFVLPLLLEERAKSSGGAPVGPASDPAGSETPRALPTAPDDGRALVAGWTWTSPTQHDDLCLGALAARWVPIEWTRVRLTRGADTCDVFVTPDALAVGRTRRMRLAPTMQGAQRILDLLSALGIGAMFPAPRIVDACRGQARVVLTHKPISPHPGSLRPADWLATQDKIEAERAGRTGLVATVGKELCLFPEMAERGLASWRNPNPAPGSFCEPHGPKCSFYGWHTTLPTAPKVGPFDAHDPALAGPGVHAIQPVSSCHTDPFSDYAQCLRIVARLAFWNGQRADLADLYRREPSMFHKGATRPIPARWPGPMPATPGEGGR